MNPHCILTMSGENRIYITAMRDLREILKLWQALEREGQPAVMATVVRTEGSSYRLPGARLLAAQDGRRAGSVSGGCLEDDILRRAWWLTANGPVLRRYDTTPDGEISTDGYGLGCNGVVHVWLERVTREQPSVLPVLRRVKEHRQPVCVEHSTGAEVFVEELVPPTRLLVFGAGADAVPLTHMANYLGWDVLVFDGRVHYAKREKFPSADTVTVREPGSPAPPIDRWTAAVVMNHSYTQDLDVLRSLASQPLRYLGMLGPRKRTVQLLLDAGFESTDPERVSLGASLHAPMGLETGGDAPEQVALAVVAEIQAVLNGKQGGFLRDREGPIHSLENDGSGEEANWVRSIVCA